jgi:hypothetical protein
MSRTTGITEAQACFRKSLRRLPQTPAEEAYFPKVELPPPPTSAGNGLPHRLPQEEQSPFLPLAEVVLDYHSRQTGKTAEWFRKTSA